MTRRKWGDPILTSLADYLQYDPLFKEWWDICRMAKGLKNMAVSNRNNSTTSGSGISHANREMDQIGVFWVNTSQKGQKYLRGQLEDGRQILAFPNNNKNKDSQPDWQVYVLRYTEDERQVLAQYASEQRAQRDANAQQQTQQQAAAPTAAAAPVVGGLPL